MYICTNSTRIASQIEQHMGLFFAYNWALPLSVAILHFLFCVQFNL